MARSRFEPLKLAGRKLSSWGVDPDSGDPVAVFADHEWKGRPLLAGQASSVPVFWTVESAAMSMGLSAADYLASHAVVVPSPRWGQAGAVVRQPRAVVWGRNINSGFRVPIAQAVQAEAAGLAAAGVFAGPVESLVFEPRSMVPVGMPFTRTAFEFDDGEFPPLSGAFIVSKFFEEAGAFGGEVLYLNYNDSRSFPYSDDYDPPGPDPAIWSTLPLLIQRDGEFLAASHEAHRRVKWFTVMGTGANFNFDGVTDGQRAEQVVGERNAAWGQYDWEAVTVSGYPTSSDADAVSALRQAIRDFFSL
jgi:hypothetical protein